MGESLWQNNRMITHVLFELQPIIIFSPVANFGDQSLVKKCYVAKAISVETSFKILPLCNSISACLCKGFLRKTKAINFNLSQKLTPFKDYI